MKIESAALFLALAASATAFAPSGMSAVRSNSVSLNILKDDVEKAELDKALGREVRFTYMCVCGTMFSTARMVAELLLHRAT